MTLSFAGNTHVSKSNLDLMRVGSLDDLKERFRQFGVDTLYIKHLAPKQDNGKNQIYLGSGLDGATNLFPGVIFARSASRSLQKRKSNAGKPKLESRIDFAWLGGNGGLSDAHNVRIIDYFQYPEVRLSGFLKGCEFPPDALRRANQAS